MLHNERIKNLLDNIIADLSANREQYVKNPGVDFTRNRKLDFETVIRSILSMKGGSLNSELYEIFGADSKQIATSSAFIQQRNKLTTDLFVDLFHNFTNAMTDMKLYKGYRLLAVDGSDINIARDESADTYCEKINQHNVGCNMYHLNAVYDLLNKIYIDAILQPKPQAEERRAFIDILENMNLTNKTLFIADRGYPSWNVFGHFKYKKNADYLIRVKNNDMSILKSLPMCEFDVDRATIISTHSKHYKQDGYTFIQVQKGKMKNRKYVGKTNFVAWDFDEEEELKFRIVRFPITEDTYETIFTSLPRDKFPIEEIKKLYGMRWGIETSFRELKYVIGLTHLHSKKDEFVRQEIFAKLTMYNFCERILAAAIVEQDNGRKYKYQINYTMGMKICLDFFRATIQAYNVYNLILQYIEAVRPGRKDKRKLNKKGFVSFTYRVAA